MNINFNPIRQTQKFFQTVNNLWNGKVVLKELNKGLVISAFFVSTVAVAVFTYLYKKNNRNDENSNNRPQKPQNLLKKVSGKKSEIGSTSGSENDSNYKPKGIEEKIQKLNSKITDDITNLFKPIVNEIMSLVSLKALTKENIKSLEKISKRGRFIAEKALNEAEKSELILPSRRGKVKEEDLTVKTAVELLEIVEFLEVKCDKDELISKELGAQFGAWLKNKNIQDTPFFEIQPRGLAIYFSSSKAMQGFAEMFQLFFIGHEKSDNSTPPQEKDFENHCCRLLIPTLQLPKFLNICFKESSLSVSKSLFSSKKMNWDKSYLNGKREAYFKEKDADFYFPLVKKLEGFSVSGHAEDKAFFLFQCKTTIADQNHVEIYINTLLSAQALFLNSNEDQIKKLSTEYQDYLRSLNSTLLPPPEVDNNTGISKHLAEHFSLLSDFFAPFVEFTPQGCIFSFDSKEYYDRMYEQFRLQNLEPILVSKETIAHLKNDLKISPALKSRLNCTDFNEFCLIVPVHHLQDLLKLARFDSNIIAPTLEDVYNNKGYNYDEVLLTYILQSPLQNKTDPKVDVACTYVDLENDEKLLQFTLSTKPISGDDAGHVIFMLDDSGSMYGRIHTATKTVINMIEEIQTTYPNTEISLFTYDNKIAVFQNATKKTLPKDWKFTVSQIKSKWGNQIPNIIDEVAQAIKLPGRQFVRSSDLKKTTLIHISDGGEEVTSQQIIDQFQKGLGDSAHPYLGLLPIIPLCIGRPDKQDEEVILGLGNKFAGHFFAEDESLEDDLKKMSLFAQNKLGLKMENVGVWVFSQTKGSPPKEFIFTKQIQLMPNNSSLSFYQKTSNFNQDLSCAVSAEGSVSLVSFKATPATKADSEIIKRNYYQSEWDKVVMQIENNFKQLSGGQVKRSVVRSRFEITYTEFDPEKLKETKVVCLDLIKEFSSSYNDYVITLPQLAKDIVRVTNNVEKYSQEQSEIRSASEGGDAFRRGFGDRK